MRFPTASAALPTLVLLVASACASSTAVSPVTSPDAAADAQVAAADAQVAAVPSLGLGAPPCGSADGPAFEHPDWPVGGDDDAAFQPVVHSSVISVGPSRFLYNVLDDAYRQLAAVDVPSSVDFYALERDPESPVASVDAGYLSSGLGRGLYRAAVDFDCVGEWGADISIQLADGTSASERLRFEVHPVGGTPAIGAPAPRSESPTATTIEAVRRISTDPNPYPEAYLSTVAEAVTSGRPSLIFFATPAFCQSGFCGPTIELVKSVARQYADEVAFVNVEPYELQETVNGLRPRLDAEGHLQPVAAAREYGIPIEPYLFIVDAEGDVFAKFEGIVGGEELQAALEDVLAGSA